MKKLLVILLALLWAGQVSAAVIPGLFNTGVDENNNGIDDYFKVNGGDAFIVSPLDGGWFPNTSASKWISVNVAGNEGGSGGTTATYTTEFDLTGYDPSTAWIKATAVWDDLLTISLNGNAVGSGGASWWQSQEFVINNYFQSGLNILSFVVQNTGNFATGLNVAFESSVRPVPLPAAAWMLGAGLVALVGVRRRMNR